MTYFIDGSYIFNIMSQLEDVIYEHTKGIVMTGPFAGMWVSREKSWTAGYLCPILLGCHECELHDPLEKEITRLNLISHPQIINVGCSEGYYAVGLKRRVPHADVSAIDIDPKALAITTTAATKNNVDVTVSDLIGKTFNHPDLIVMDCEGEEATYLKLDTYPGLANSSIIVEMHLDEKNTINLFIERFKVTHSINLYVEGPRNPNLYPILHNDHSVVRWLAVCEGRPVLMGWLVMVPKTPASCQ